MLTVVIITEADDCGPGGKMPKVISKCDKNNDYGEIILEGGDDHEEYEDDAQCTKATLGAMHCRSTFGKYGF